MIKRQVLLSAAWESWRCVEQSASPEAHGLQKGTAAQYLDGSREDGIR